MSQYATSPTTSRPPSRTSRPPSAASQRTASRISHRPLSRISQRTSTRQSRSLCQALVTRITGFIPDQDHEFDAAFDTAIRRIDSIAKQAVSPDMKTVQSQLRRFGKKARIQSNDELAEAFDVTSKMLRAETEKRGDLDNEISTSKLPEHIQLLLLLASPPSSSTLDYATQLVERAHNPPSGPSTLTWTQILKEEPLEGQHWQGAYGLPPGSVIGQWDQGGSTDSSPLLSPVSDSELDDRDDLYSTLDSRESTDISDGVITPPPPDTANLRIEEERLTETLRLRFKLDALQRQQYWRKGWKTDARVDRPFDLGEPATLDPSFQRAIYTLRSPRLPNLENERYINEHDAIREILIALQGRFSILFESKVDKHGLPIAKVSDDSPRLLHLTPSAQFSVMSKFAHLATSLMRLRVFSTAVVRNTMDLDTTPGSTSRTVEAFGEALSLYIIRFEAWVAHREENILRSHQHTGKSTTISLLSLEKAIRNEVSDTFDELLNIICTSFPSSAWLNRDRILAHVRLSPSSFSSRLLDLLFETVERRQSFGDVVTASRLMRIFLGTAEPVWRMLGRWLRDGIFMPEASNSVSDQNTLPQEFFIESYGLNIADPDFWAEGYGLRSLSFDESASIDSGVPIFLRSLAENILGAGKSVGLLRILGHSGSFDSGNLSASAWPTFEVFMLDLMGEGNGVGSNEMQLSSSIMTAENLTLLLSDHLLPICTSAGKMLKDVLYSDCELLLHLRVTEDLFLSRKGDVMVDFCDVVFTAIDAKKMWTDYHFLNTAFREAAGSSKSRWIDSSLVRLSYKSSPNSTLHRSTKCFDGLTVEYTAPFPLVFVVGSAASQVYNSILVLLIKIRRAKTVLDNILLRGSAANTIRIHDEMKIFYTTRSKLSWFVNAYLDFICSYVLHVEVERFHASLRGAGSLDDVIDLHKKHLVALEKLCFLDNTTAALQRALLSILDLSVAFSDCFIAFAGDTTLNTSRASLSHSRRHRSRKQRRESRNIVSLAPISSFLDEESDSSDSDLDESLILQEITEDKDTSCFAAPSIYESYEEEDLFSRNEKMVKDLDALVRYMRREVERLALTADGSQFGILAFSLQEWDL